MKRRKSNISLWRLLGLTAVVVIGCLLAATGKSLARYKAETEGSLWFSAQVPEEVYLGKVVQSADGTSSSFDPEAEGSWEMVDGCLQMSFAVANGAEEEEYAEKDQQFRVQLVGSLGVWDGTQTVEVKLLVPTQEDPTDNEEFAATATRIQPQSPMYSEFGDGWVFSFRDDREEELTWILEGGKFSVCEMYIVLEGTELTDSSLLQLQIVGDYI